MHQLALGMGLVAACIGAGAEARTDFAIRTIVPSASGPREPQAAVPAGGPPAWSLEAAARIGAEHGRVTSLKRSPAHNRRVGGVPNSYHLSGRAIDIARRPGVSHAQIAQSYRQAGYHLVESLDEGDHSHFAFGTPGTRSRVAARFAAPQKAGPGWKMVSAPRFREPEPERPALRLSCDQGPCTTAEARAPIAIATP